MSPRHSWRQDPEIVTVLLPVPANTDSGGIEWSIDEGSVTIAVEGGGGLRDAALARRVRPDGCSWALEGDEDMRRVVVTLAKEDRSEWPFLLRDEELRASEVIINVYDVTPAMNVVLGAVGFGVHHTGVEVYGHEFCFGRESGGASGLRCMPPRSPIGHEYRESLPMGRTPLSRTEVLALVRCLLGEWSGERYHLTRCNCNHFAEAFVRQLLAPARPQVPEWLNRAARGCDSVLPSAVTERVNDADAAAFDDMKRRIANLQLEYSSVAQEQRDPH